MIWFRILAGFAIIWMALFLGVMLVDHMDTGGPAWQFATSFTCLIALLFWTVYVLVALWEEQ